MDTATIPSAADALKALQAYQMPSSADVLTQAENKYGVADTRNRVNTYKTLTNNLTGAIAAVDPSVTGRTSGSLVTEGQRSALVNRERAPIAGQLGTANQGLSQATTDMDTAVGNAKNEAARTISDNTAKYERLKDVYAIANAREQAAAEAEAKRQALEYAKQQDARELAYKYSARSSGGGSGGGGGSDSSPHAQQRAGGGFNFQDANNKSISARTYASQAGISFNALIKQMASAGDAGAKDVLKNGTKSKYWTAFNWG